MLSTIREWLAERRAQTLDAERSNGQRYAIREFRAAWRSHTETFAREAALRATRRRLRIEANGPDRTAFDRGILDVTENDWTGEEE